MPIRFLCIMAVLLLGSASCLKRDFHSGIQQVGVDPACPNGVVSDFKLDAVPSMPAAASVDWPTVASRRTVVSPSTKENLHLRVCMGADFSSVEKVLQVNMKFVRVGNDGAKYSGTLSVEPAAGDVLEGISEAIFQDYSKLRIEVRKGDYGIYAKGWDNGGKPVVTAEMVMDFREYEGDEPTRLGSRTVVGTITEGHPFHVEDERCGVEPYRRSRYRVGTAVIDTEQCLGPDLAGASSMKILKVKVHDTHPSLGGPLSATFEGGALDSALQTRFYHHGGCTYFVLNAGRVRYGMRNLAVGAGCDDNELPEIVRADSRAGKMIADYGTATVMEPIEFAFWPEPPQWYRPAKVVFREATHVEREYMEGSESVVCDIPANTELIADGAGPESDYDKHVLTVFFKAGSIPACPKLKAVKIDAGQVVLTPVDEAPL